MGELCTTGGNLDRVIEYPFISKLEPYMPEACLGKNTFGKYRFGFSFCNTSSDVHAASPESFVFYKRNMKHTSNYTISKQKYVHGANQSPAYTK